MSTHVAALVVGAGISGLACAYALRKAGADVLLVESSSRAGGLIRSERRDGYLLEFGPQSFSGAPQLLDLCRDLGIEDQLLTAPPRAPRFLIIHGQLRPVPLSPLAFFISSLFGVRTKWRVLHDAFGRSSPPEADESVADFVRRKFSPELLDTLVGPFVSGIYAGDPEKLSLRSAFQQVHEAEVSAGSVIRGMLRGARSAKARAGSRKRPTLQAFREGNETIVQALATNLGPSLRCGAEATALRRGGAGSPHSGARFVVDVKSGAGTESIIADHLVLATPPNVAANLLATASEKIENRLSEITFAPMAVVSLGYRRSDVGHALEGFGFLIPRSAGLRTLGTVWNSSYFAGRAPAGHVLLTSFVGGAADPGAASLKPEELTALVHQELALILSLRNAPVFSNVQTHESALPQYALGHSARTARPAEYGFTCSNLWLAGNYLRGPSLGACVEQALSVADEICRVVKQKPREVL